MSAFFAPLLSVPFRLNGNTGKADLGHETEIGWGDKLKVSYSTTENIDNLNNKF